MILNISNLLVGYISYSSIEYLNDPIWLRYFILYNIIWILIALVNPPYNVLSGRLLKLYPLLRSVTLNLLIHGSIIIGFIEIPFSNQNDSFIQIYIITLAGVYSTRWLILIGIKWYRKKGFNYRNIVLISTEETNEFLTEHLETHRELGYHLKGFFSTTSLNHFEDKKSELRAYFNTNEIDEVFINPEELDDKKLANIIDFCEDEFIKVKMLSDIGLILNRKIEINNFGLFWLLEVSPLPLDQVYNRIFKRAFDLIFSVLVLITFFSWLYPIVWIIIYLESGTPILFKQKRSGEKNQPFTCLKFRTMYNNDNADIIQSTKNDSRITRIGKFLRKTSLDEMPQFINVLRGEMSIVGPRPHMLKHTEDYSKIVDRFLQRHHVKPGITGLAQIKGYRGEVSNIQDIKGRVNFDKFYIENWSMALDLNIIANTIKFIFMPPKQAY